MLTRLTELAAVSLIDYIAVSGSIETNVLEYVDHLHEHFESPCTINARGRYNVSPSSSINFSVSIKPGWNFSLHAQVPLDPDEGYSVEFKAASKAEFTFPGGSYWSSPEAKKAHGLE